MKINKLRLTNVIENHFYLDFNWKDESAHPSVSRLEARGIFTARKMTTSKIAIIAQETAAIFGAPRSFCPAGDRKTLSNS